MNLRYQRASKLFLFLNWKALKIKINSRNIDHLNIYLPFYPSSLLLKFRNYIRVSPVVRTFNDIPLQWVGHVG